MSDSVFNFDKEFKRLIERESLVHDAKRNDYTGDRDPFYNYGKAADIMGVSTGTAMLGRMMEKVTRLQILLSGTDRRVSDETIEDTAVDIAIIAKLIAIWWRAGHLK